MVNIFNAKNKSLVRNEPRLKDLKASVLQYAQLSLLLKHAVYPNKYKLKCKAMMHSHINLLYADGTFMCH